MLSHLAKTTQEKSNTSDYKCHQGNQNEMDSFKFSFLKLKFSFLKLTLSNVTSRTTLFQSDFRGGTLFFFF